LKLYSPIYSVEEFKQTANSRGDENHDSTDNLHDEFQAAIMKKTRMEGMLEAYSNNSKACSETVTKHETMEVDSVGYVVPEQTKDFSLDSDYSWIEDDGAQPWWKTTDRNELAFLVLQKSLNYVENCDLPPPRKKYLGEQSYAEAKEGLDSGLMHRKMETPSNEGHLSFSFDKSSVFGLFAYVLLVKNEISLA
jgi:hypothetical protein